MINQYIAVRVAAPRLCGSDRCVRDGGLHFDMGSIAHAGPHLDPGPLPLGQGVGDGELPQSVSALSSEHERVHSVLFHSHPAAPTPHFAFD